MNNLFLKKLQIKEGFKVLLVNAPQNSEEIIGSADQVDVITVVDEPDAILIFARNKADFNELLGVYAKEIKSKTICWIFYPKAKSALASDLNLMQNWHDLKKYSLTPCGSAAVDEIWTGLRIKPETEMKKSGLGNNEIANSDLGKYIDVTNKIITLPSDLLAELEKNVDALNFYHKLSYSNRKEYVLWVISAKQEKTRNERIKKTLEKLALGKKNPSEK